MTYHCDFTRRERSRLAEYPLEAASGLTYHFGSLSRLATHDDDASVWSVERETVIMSDSGTIIRILEAIEDHEIPQFTLQRRRLSIRGIPAGGYEVIAACHGTRFRFTAVLYRQDTTHLVF